MRVVRLLLAQPFETAMFTRNGHMMARQEIFAWWWVLAVIEFIWSVLIPVATALTAAFWGGSRILSDIRKVKAGILSPRAKRR